MDTKDRLIKKLEEYIFALENNMVRFDLNNSTHEKLRSEIASLEKQIKEQKSNPLELIKGITENTPELNMCNYSVEQVHILNDALIEIYQITHK